MKEVREDKNHFQALFKVENLNSEFYLHMAKKKQEASLSLQGITMELLKLTGSHFWGSYVGQQDKERSIGMTSQPEERTTFSAAGLLPPWAFQSLGMFDKKQAPLESLI